MNDFTNDHSQGDALDHVELPPEELFNLLSDRAVFGLDDAESERLEAELAEISKAKQPYLEGEAPSSPLGAIHSFGWLYLRTPPTESR